MPSKFTLLRPVYTERDHDHERDHCDFPRDLPLESLHEPPFIQTGTVIPAVTVAMSATMLHLMKMAANVSDTDSDDIGILPLHTEEEKKEEIEAYIYRHPILQKRHIYGEYPAYSIERSEIELNRTQSNEIEHRTLCEKSNPIELNPLDCVRLGSATELNRTQSN